jgi:hypothetical protein
MLSLGFVKGSTCIELFYHVIQFVASAYSNPVRQYPPIIEPAVRPGRVEVVMQAPLLEQITLGRFVGSVVDGSSSDFSSQLVETGKFFLRHQGDLKNTIANAYPLASVPTLLRLTIFSTGPFKDEARSRRRI